MKNSQSGEVVTLISVITLVALTIFTAFSSQFIAQKQTTNTKAEDYLGCSCGEETDYSVCNQYGTQQVITGYNQVCTDWDEYNECIASGDDYNNPIYEDDVDYSNCIEYGKKCIACTDNNEDYQTQNTDEQCECLNGYYTDACGVDAAGTYCPGNSTNEENTDEITPSQEESNLPDEYCDYNISCSLDYVSDEGMNYPTICSDTQEQIGSCRLGGVNGVCCKDTQTEPVLKIDNQQVEENQDFSIDGLTVSASISDNYAETYNEENPADVYLNPQGDGSFKPVCDEGVSLYINTDSEYELVDDNGNVVQTGTSFNLCN